MFTAIRRASSSLSSLAADRRSLITLIEKREAVIKIALVQSTEFTAVDHLAMQAAGVPDNLPTPTNSIAIFVALCIFIFGGMAFAKFMGRRERE